MSKSLDATKVSINEKQTRSRLNVRLNVQVDMLQQRENEETELGGGPLVRKLWQRHQVKCKNG